MSKQSLYFLAFYALVNAVLSTMGQHVSVKKHRTDPAFNKGGLHRAVDLSEDDRHRLQQIRDEIDHILKNAGDAYPRQHDKDQDRPMRSRYMDLENRARMLKDPTEGMSSTEKTRDFRIDHKFKQQKKQKEVNGQTKIKSKASRYYNPDNMQKIGHVLEGATKYESNGFAAKKQGVENLSKYPWLKHPELRNRRNILEKQPRWSGFYDVE